MTETLTPPTAAADSPLALLFDIALEIGVQGEDEQREDAKTAALHHVWSHYPDTLGKAVDEDDWSGRPALPEAGWEACAVAYLDGGLWLHHSSDGDQERDVLTLIAPCTCGNGYVDTALGGEWDLLQVLTELRATGGRFPHHNDYPDCGSQRLLRDWSATRP
ncbi:hypothetical protein [Streptomyces sp. NBC_00989]|uniref:hypothetical protein n=1 Tax=Streptomyces sp. NBC_00989 TaxID=2903705 RepID=UPI002F919979|nr:hypothetical protein OG714_54990 [Streptomyces sp. NBC_00989]